MPEGGDPLAANRMAETLIPDAHTGLVPTPRSFIDGNPTRPWCHIPGDHQRPASPASYDLYWDHVDRFGMVDPRAADPWETLAYYETEGEPYYTHRASAGEPQERGSTPLPARLLMRLAWAQDWGVVFSAQEVDRCCPRR